MVHDGWMNGQTDGKSDISRSVPYLKKVIFRTQCNSLWDEKKKEGIISQIILSKLLYIAQISAIPKLIQEKIEKEKSSNLHLD